MALCARRKWRVVGFALAAIFERKEDEEVEADFSKRPNASVKKRLRIWPNDRVQDTEAKAEGQNCTEANYACPDEDVFVKRCTKHIEALV